MERRKWQKLWQVMLLVSLALACMGTGKRETGVKILACKVPYSEKKDGAETVLTIGSLTVRLPAGWQVEKRGEGAATQYFLRDAHSRCEDGEVEKHKEGYEHEIVITPYVISGIPEDTLELAAEVREYFPTSILYGIPGSGRVKETEGCRMYGENRDTEEKEYFLFFGKGSKRHLFHVRESSIYAYANEVENFGDFLDYGLVRAEGKKDVKDCRSYDGQRAYYFWVNRKQGKPLFVVMEGSTGERAGTITVYQKGDYGSPLASRHVKELYPGQMEVADLDQDGNGDFLCRYWLLDPLRSLAFADEEDFDGYLWDEERETFVYTSGAKMLSRYGGIWEEQRNKQGSLDGAEKIPDGLKEYLSGCLLSEREKLRDAMLPLVSDRELDPAEVKKLAEDNPAIGNEMQRIAAAYDGSGVWLMVDADNDGIEDVYLCEFLGGTLGSVYYHLFKGDGNGSYELTDKLEELKEEFAFLEWEGRNYLARTTWNFTKKVYNGVSLGCYEEGVFQGGIWLSITPKEGKDGREIKTFYLKDEKYRDLEKGLIKLANAYQSEDRIGPGTAESEDEREEYERSCDIDNDGNEERYRVSLWQTTNYYTVDHVNFHAMEEEINDRVWELINEENNGIPKNFWVDETRYGNIIYLLFEDGLYDFHICGWLLSETEKEKLIQVTCRVQREVTEEVMAVRQ